MKNYIVFGGAKSGIGEAISKKLLDSGAAVWSSSERDDVDLAKKIKNEYPKFNNFEIDHSSYDSLNDFIKNITAKIDGIVIAQMYFDIRKVSDFSIEEWNRTLAVNISLPQIVATKLSSKIKSGGAIVIISSTEGFVGSFGAGGYAASKAAVHNLVKTHANILGRDNVRINAIAAGWIGGVMDTDEVFNRSRAITPLGRLGDPKEIAAVTYFLLGDDSSFMTGTTVVVDGGYSCVDAISKFEYESLK